MRQGATTEVLRSSFGAVASEYDRLRPGPAPEALDWLLPTAATDVLELGAGTGVLTRLLAERIRHVTAVEPDDRMRALLPRSSGLEVLAGCAEDLPAPDANFDVVLAASAWHWVDEQRAVPEVARVLRPQGRLALVWSGPDRSVDWMQSLWAGGTELSTDAQIDAERRRQRRRDVNVDRDGQSRFETPETKLFRWTRSMAKADLVALAATYSGVITMDESTRNDHLQAMARFLDELDWCAGTSVVNVPMGSYCWRATRR